MSSKERFNEPVNIFTEEEWENGDDAHDLTETELENQWSKFGKATPTKARGE